MEKNLTQDTQVQHRPEPVFGMDDEILGSLSSIPMSYEELPANAFDDKPFTLVGYSEKKGGETRVDEVTGNTWDTSDQWLLHWRADDPEIAAMLNESKGVTIQYLNLPKSYAGANGVARRSNPTRQTQAGLFIAALDNVGISSNSQRGHALVMKSWDDLLGLQAVRKRMAFTGSGRNARTTEIDVPVRILGMDNDYRKTLGLGPINVKVEQPELNT
jgi:hypothetical protein